VLRGKLLSANLFSCVASDVLVLVMLLVINKLTLRGTIMILCDYLRNSDYVLTSRSESKLVANRNIKNTTNKTDSFSYSVHRRK
jgi:hypothetical protein